MGRNRVMTLGLAGIFTLLAAAVTLFLAGTVTTRQADYLSQTKINRFFSQKYHIEYIIYSGEKSMVPSEQFNEFFQYGKNLRYNLLSVNPDGKIQYKLNDNFISGDTCVFAGTSDQPLLIDPKTYVAAALHTDGNSATIPAIGNLSFLGSGTEINVCDEINVSLDDIKAEDSQQYFVWLYDANKKAYLESDIYAPLRAQGVTLRVIAAAALGVYWLALALWVLFDARRFDRRGWIWAVLLMLTNVAGFCIYTIARSQGFSPMRACLACGKPMNKKWIRCPYCGETEESGL